MATMRRALLSVGLAILLAVVAVLLTPVVAPNGWRAPAPSATPEPRAARTHRPTETLLPADTATFPPFAPTAEPAWTLTPSAMPTLPFQVLSSTSTLPFSIVTPTVSHASPTPTRPAPLALDCKLIWQSPPSGSSYILGEKFAVGWDIRNTGTVTWEPDSFTFTYLGGARLATHDFEIPLKESVPPGQETVLSVPMKTPLTPNFYTTHWGIRQGDTYFCRLTLTIRAQ